MPKLGTGPADTSEATALARRMLRAHWDRDGALALAPIAGGNINQSWRVGDAPDAVLQCLHARFDGSESARIATVAPDLRRAGVTVPALAPTRTGAATAAGPDGRQWRLLRWIPGRSLAQVPDVAHAQAGARLIARFHDALLESAAGRALPRTAFHDTATYMAALRQALGQAAPVDADGAIRRTGEAILAFWRDWQQAAADAPPTRPTHGDLKISNLLFAEDSPQAVALIDLDTLARDGLDAELGDAFRSWCNRRGEDVTQPLFDEDLFAAAVQGYLAEARTVTVAERRLFVHGAGRIAVELACRYCEDAVMDRYWGWDPAIAPTRRAHNLLRAQGQLALAQQIAHRRAALERIVASS